MHVPQHEITIPPNEERALLETYPYLQSLPAFLLLSCGHIWVSPALASEYPVLGEQFSIHKLTRFLPEPQRNILEPLVHDRYRLLAATFDQKIPLLPPLDHTLLAIRQLFYHDGPNWLGILYPSQFTDRPKAGIAPAVPPPITDFEPLLQSSDIGFWQFDGQTRQVYFSDAIYKLLGYAPGELKSPVEAISPTDYNLVRVILEAMIQYPAPKDNKIEVNFCHKSGSSIPILFTIHAEGTRYLGTYHSVEESAALRKALKRVTEKAELRAYRFQVLFDTLPEMVFIADKQTGTIINCNRVVKDKLGYEPEELTGQHFTILLPEGHKNEGLAKFNSDSTAHSFLIFTLRTKSGQLVDTQISETIIDHYGKPARLTIFSDKTKLVAAERRAERRERQYRQLIKYSSDVISISSKAFRILWVSDNIESKIGYASHEMIGTKLLDLIHPEDLHPATQYLLQQIEQDQPEFTYTARYKHKDGRYLWLENHTIRTVDDEGKPIGITYSRDITAQVELQEKRAEMDRLKREFVSMASHQLRTPMAVFAANLEMLMEAEEAQSPFLKRILSRMERESNRMVSLVDDVLAVSKLNSNEELQANKTPVEIVSFLRQILADESFYFEEAPIVLRSEIQSGEIIADEEQLTHLLHNLLSNAIKYSERRDPPEVHTCQLTDGRIQINIKDHGIGIPEMDRPNLFQQFHRAANAKKIAGTGLGLYIVKRFADANNIHIAVNSKEDIGTTFSLTFNNT